MKNNILRNIFKQKEEPVKQGFTVDMEYAESLPDEKAEVKSGPAESVFEWIEVIATAVIAVVVIFSLLFRVATIEGDSMKNTLYDNEKIIISNFLYEPEQGDIVVISRNIDNSADSQTDGNGPIIKRVIAVEGQTVDIDFETGTVSVDGKALKEDYISTPTLDQSEVEFPVTVSKGCIFVLGDNRAVSLDSRSAAIGDNGMIDKRYVLGHAVFRIFPFNRIGRLDNK